MKWQPTNIRKAEKNILFFRSIKLNSKELEIKYLYHRTQNMKKDIECENQHLIIPLSNFFFQEIIDNVEKFWVNTLWKTSKWKHKAVISRMTTGISYSLIITSYFFPDVEQYEYQRSYLCISVHVIFVNQIPKTNFNFSKYRE